MDRKKGEPPGCEVTILCQLCFVGVPDCMDIWAMFSPVSLVTVDLLGGNLVVIFGQVLGH